MSTCDATPNPVASKGADFAQDTTGKTSDSAQDNAGSAGDEVLDSADAAKVENGGARGKSQAVGNVGDTVAGIKSGLYAAVSQLGEGVGRAVDTLNQLYGGQ